MSRAVRKRRDRDAVVVTPAAFAWDRATAATLQHSTLPWDTPLAGLPLVELTGIGARDRLSLLAQFAAHQAFLQFAGIADSDLDPAEWMVVQKRGCDSRLVRIAARDVDPVNAPPVLSLAQQFAEHTGASLEILRESWARADAIYTEAFLRIDRDAAADQTWVRAAAAGSLAAPGADGLRELESLEGTVGYSEPACVDAVRRFVAGTSALQLVELRGVSPLERYSALGGLARGVIDGPATVAERILARTTAPRHVFIVTNLEAYDPASREVVAILASARHGAWLLPGDTDVSRASRPFLVAPRLDARANVSCDPAEFASSRAFTKYLQDGYAPAGSAVLPAIGEPARSLIGALALLGDVIPLELARRFLEDFMYGGAVTDLAVAGVLTIEDESFHFASRAVREEAARLLPAASRAAICRAAANHATGANAARLWLDAGDAGAAARTLESVTWPDAQSTVDALHLFPRSILTPLLASRLAHALIDCGRYRDAREVAAGDELALARIERRTGDYALALQRLEHMEPTFETTLLMAELLRLQERDEEAVATLGRCAPSTPDEQLRLDYERGLHGTKVALPPGSYLERRLQTYRAIERGECELAACLAAESKRVATNVIERIDASLDRLFAAFTNGEWDAARAIAVESLREVEETQGDRAAGGILFTLAYLSADDGQWQYAAQRISRLRQYYTATGDSLRLNELHLLVAHLELSRGRFADARRHAQTIFESRGHHDQIREASALILDELDWIESQPAPARATGKSANRELTRRYERLRAVKRGAVPELAPDSRADMLFAFRHSVAVGDRERSANLARELGITYEPGPLPAEAELAMLRAAATREYPFAPHDFERDWLFASRNRLGHWSMIGSRTADAAVLDAGGDSSDWIGGSERELLFIEGVSGWSVEGRDAIAALFHTRAENHRLRRLVANDDPPPRSAIEGIVGHSPAIREVESMVARVAKRDVPTCILGESGTGKELVARAIHRQSPRRQKPFTAINCAALPENLIESELFGHVRGAFTGADRDRTGLIESTDGGTLFLDEIGELPLTSQAKLLRFLQEGEFRRVGDVANRAADVRVVAATNRKLDVAVEEGRFREDLYYRIRGVEIALPPLRERGGDVLLLARHFLAVEKSLHSAGPGSLSPDVEALFDAYRWPGNVRELQNTIRGAHAMAGEAREIDVQHLPERLRNVVPTRRAPGSWMEAVTTFKRDLIERSLLHARGNQNQAASLLGMSRQALAYQIRELGIMVRA